MKKIICMLLIFLIVFSLSACGLSNVGDIMEDLENIENQYNEYNEVQNKREKEDFYFGYFRNNKNVFAGDSYYATQAGLFMKNENEDGGHLWSQGDDALISYYEMYKTSNGKQYAYLEDNNHPSLVECDAEDDIFSLFHTNIDLTLIDYMFDGINKIDYDKTEDGVDYITVNTSYVITKEMAKDLGYKVDENSNNFPRDVSVAVYVAIDVESQKIISMNWEHWNNEGLIDVKFYDVDSIDLVVEDKLKTINVESYNDEEFASICNELWIDIISRQELYLDFASDF